MTTKEMCKTPEIPEKHEQIAISRALANQRIETDATELGTTPA